MKKYVVIDTNVLASALITRNENAPTVKILKYLSQNKIVPVYSSNIVKEYYEVLRREKFKLSEEIVSALINNVDKNIFLKDLKEKDYCIILKDNTNNIKGFSTQKIMKFNFENEEIYGVFSGDTIIDKENWGNLTLFKVFANFFFPFGEKYKNFYW